MVDQAWQSCCISAFSTFLEGLRSLLVAKCFMLLTSSIVDSVLSLLTGMLIRFFTELLILLLFVVLFSQPIREDLVIAAYCPFIYMYVCFANPPQTFPGIQRPTHAILNILCNLSLLTCI